MATYSMIDWLYNVKILSYFSVFCVLLLPFCILKQRSIYLTWIYPKVQGRFYVPLLGHLGLYRLISPSMDKILQFFDFGATQSGRMINLLGVKVIPISKPEHLEVVLSHPHTQRKSFIYRYLECFLGNSLLMSYGTHYKKNRKALAPVMQIDAVAPHVDSMCKHFDRLCNSWSNKTETTTDFMPDITTWTFRSFLDSTFGVNADTLKGGENIEYYVDRFSELAIYRGTSVFKHPDFIYKWTNDHKLQQEALSYINNIFKQIYDERKKIYCQRRKKQLGHSAPKHQIFIDYMFDLLYDKQFTEKDVQDECKLFLLAGLDTSASGIAFTLILLAMNQDIQNKVLQEVLDVIGPDRNPEYEDLSKLVYLENVIKESFRIFPPAAAMSRVCEEEFVLDDHIVPKGTELILLLMHTHRSKKYWKDPLSFDPDRFTPENSTKQKKYSYLPFSSGPRTCFGVRIAWITLKCALAMLIRKYKFSTNYKTVDDVKLSYKITLKASDGVMLSIEERK